MPNRKTPSWKIQAVHANIAQQTCGCSINIIKKFAPRKKEHLKIARRCFCDTAV